MMMLLLPTGFFAVAVLLHGLFLRSPPYMSSVPAFLIVGFPVGGVLCILSFYFFGLSLAAWAIIFLYALLCELYIFSFTLVVTSVSAAMLITLLRPNISATSVSVQYDSREMVELRIRRLLGTGLISGSGGVYIPTAKGLKLQRTVERLRRFFRHTSL